MCERAVLSSLFLNDSVHPFKILNPKMHLDPVDLARLQLPRQAL